MNDILATMVYFDTSFNIGDGPRPGSIAGANDETQIIGGNP